MVYGGATVGLMGALAGAALTGGARLADPSVPDDRSLTNNLGRGTPDAGQRRGCRPGDEVGACRADKPVRARGRPCRCARCRRTSERRQALPFLCPNPPSCQFRRTSTGRSGSWRWHARNRASSRSLRRRGTWCPPSSRTCRCSSARSPRGLPQTMSSVSSLGRE